MLPAAFFLTTCLLPSIQTCNNFKLICLDNSQLRNPRFLCDKVVNVNSASTSCTQTGLTPGTNGVCTNGVCTNGLQPTGARGNTDISDGASCSGVSEVQEEVQADKLEEVEGVRLAVEVECSGLRGSVLVEEAWACLEEVECLRQRKDCSGCGEQGMRTVGRRSYRAGGEVEQVGSEAWDCRSKCSPGSEPRGQQARTSVGDCGADRPQT